MGDLDSDSDAEFACGHRKDGESVRLLMQHAMLEEVSHNYIKIQMKL